MIPVARIAAFTLISGGIALGTLAMADVAHADPGTREVAWLVTSGSFANRFGTPQTLYTGSLECGTGLLQIDTYKYVTDADKATVDNLIASGHLDSAAQDGSVWLSNKDVELKPCATTPSTDSPAPSPTSPTTTPTSSTVPTAPSPTGTPTPTTTTPAVETGTPSPVPPVVTPQPIETTTSPAVVPSASSTLTATSTPTSRPVAAGSNRNGTGTTAAQTNGSTELAYTGTNTGPAIGGAVVLLVGGLLMLAIGKKGKQA